MGTQEQRLAVMSASFMSLTMHPCRGQQSIRELCHGAARENASQHCRAVGEAPCPFIGLPQAPNLSSVHLINYPSCQHPFSCLHTLPSDPSVARLQLGPLAWVPFPSQYLTVPNMCVHFAFPSSKPFWFCGRRTRQEEKGMVVSR